MKVHPPKLPFLPNDVHILIFQFVSIICTENYTMDDEEPSIILALYEYRPNIVYFLLCRRLYKLRDHLLLHYGWNPLSYGWDVKVGNIPSHINKSAAILLRYFGNQLPEYELYIRIFLANKTRKTMHYPVRDNAERILIREFCDVHGLTYTTILKYNDPHDTCIYCNTRLFVPDCCAYKRVNKKYVSSKTDDTSPQVKTVGVSQPRTELLGLKITKPCRIVKHT